MEFLYAYIKNICVFTLVITLVLNIFPDKSYKKYIKLFAGLLLLAIIFNPIIKLKKTKINIDKAIRQYSHGSYRIELEKDLEEISTKMYERFNNEYQTDN